MDVFGGSNGGRVHTADIRHTLFRRAQCCTASNIRGESAAHWATLAVWDHAGVIVEFLGEMPPKRRRHLVFRQVEITLIRFDMLHEANKRMVAENGQFEGSP